MRAELWPEAMEAAHRAEAAAYFSRQAHAALGFEEVVQIRCFRKPLG
jgi:hypothetical protein